MDSCDELYEMYKTDVYRFAHALCDNAKDAEDLFQETWLRAVQSGLRSPAGDANSPKAWLFTIAANLQRDALRKKRVRRLFFLERTRSMAEVAADADAGWDSGRLAGQDPSARTEFGLCLRRAISKLPARERRVFVLKDVEGFKHAEIGRMLHIPETTVRTVLHRAIKRLQRDLAAFDPARKAAAPVLMEERL